MFFYLVFAAALLLARKQQAIFISVILMSLVALGLFFHPVMAGPAIYTNPLLLEFLAGTGIAMLADRLRLSALQACGLAVAALLALAVTPLLRIDLDPWRVVVWGLPACLLVSAVVGYEQLHSPPKIEVAKQLGDASYSIYLFHGLAIFWAWRLPHIPELLRAPLALIFAVAFGVALFRFVESPINKQAHKLLS